MAVAMKGIIKGIRYITSMFDHPKEPEIQIGGPTDVKHVAHIGWDGPTANAPSWMDQFKGEGGDPNASPQGSRDLPEVGASPAKPRGKGGKNGAGGSDAAPKHSRKKKTKTTSSQSGGGSSSSNKKAKGRVAQTETE